MRQKKVRWIEFEENGDEYGKLIAIEQYKEIPFELKRIFYVFGIDQNSTRGRHANRNSNFLMIALNGKVNVTVDDGNERVTYILDSPKRGLLIERMTWKEMHEFSIGSVLLIISDTFYDSTEYIQDYNTFLKEIKEGNGL